MKFLDIWPFDLTPSHQFDHRVKILLAFCSTHHSHHIDMPHDHVRKNNLFCTLGYPGVPKSQHWDMTQASEQKSHLICFISSICKNTHKVWYKNLWNWLCYCNLLVFDLLTPPQSPRGWGQNFFAVAYPIYVSNSHTKFGWILSNG